VREAIAIACSLALRLIEMKPLQCGGFVCAVWCVSLNSNICPVTLVILFSLLLTIITPFIYLF